MTRAITYVGWGGRPAHVPADFDMGKGHFRDVPAFGLRRAIWDAAFGYVCGFKKRAIVYYVVTRSFSRVLCEFALRREGVEYSGGFGSVPIARRGSVRRSDAEAIADSKAVDAVTHVCPSSGSGLTPCCARTPFELPRSDRITLDRSLVTCPGIEGLLS